MIEREFVLKNGCRINTKLEGVVLTLELICNHQPSGFVVVDTGDLENGGTIEIEVGKHFKVNVKGE